MSTLETENEKQAHEKQLALVQVLDALRPVDTEMRIRVLRAAAAFFGLYYMGRVGED